VSTLVLINPWAGRGRGRKLQSRVERGLRDAGVRCELVETTGPGHALGLARDAAARGVERLIVAGGDGTMHEATNGLLQATTDKGPTRTALGLIPLGTGNDFAKLVNVHGLPPEAAAARMARGETRRFDVGRALGEYFDNMLGIGFDAEANKQAHRMQRLRGTAVYLAAVYKTFVSFRPPILEVRSAEHTETSPMMMLAASIGVCAGGGFYLTPSADPADGLLDVCAIRKVGLWRFLTAVPKVLKGTHTQLDEVSMFRTRRVTIRCDERPLVLHLDGEPREPGLHEVEVTVEPARLTVLVGR
jgi:diacylglycerol kinase (ATP)